MAIITPADFTWNGKEVMSLSEAIIEKAYSKPALSDVHTLVTGIKAKQQIAFLSRIGLVGKKHTNGTCEPTASTQSSTGSEKFWDPAMIEDRFTECWDNFRESFFIWGLKNGIKKGDLTGTDAWNFMKEVISDAQAEAVLRLAWFGDTAAANYNDSPAGVITNGVDTDFFSPFDGLFKQLFAIGTADSNRLNAIAQNAEATYANQRFDSTDTTNKVVSTLFRSMITSADYRLRDQSDIRIYCTQSLADQYVTELEAQGQEPAFEIITNGISRLTRNGVEIIALNFWDRYINSYQNNGTKWYRPHRAVLTTKSNIQIGCEEESNLSELDPFYLKKEKQFVVDFAFNMDAKVVEDYLVQLAY
jgi:hypothetical protein